MAFKTPFGSHNFLGNFVDDAAALIFIKAVKFDTTKDGNGNPEEGMWYSNTTTHKPRYYNGSSWEDMGGGGVGDVVGPSGATNEGVARFDGTTGKLIQNSSVIIGDDGYVSIPSGQKYKINGVNLSATDVGAEPTLTKGNLTELNSGILSISGGTSSVIGSGTSIQVQKASASQDGYLGKNDWSTFNNKQNSITPGNLTSGTSSAISISGGTGAVIGSGASVSINKASASLDGYLGKNDWTTFNSKEPAQTKGTISETASGVLIVTNGSSSTVGPNVTIQVRKASASQDGYLGKNDFATFSSSVHSPVTLSASAVTGGLSLSTQEISFRAADTTYDGYLKSSDWDTFNGKMSDPMSARGDIICRNSSNVTDRLALGDDGYILASDGSDVVWKKPSTSYLSQDFTSQTSIVVNHNLGAYPVVQVLDSSKEVVIPQSITNSSVNSFTVTFPEATSGTILVTLGTSSSVGTGGGGTLSKSFMISNPTADASSPLWRVPAASTITHIHVLCIGGTNIVGQLWEYDSNGVNGATVDSDITATAGTNANDGGSISNPNIAAGNYLGWKTTSVSGTPTGVIVTFEYTED